MRIVFMGTPDFAVPSLQALLNAGLNVVGVVTQPDKPKGRGRKLEPPPVKVLAQERKIPVLQPAKIKTDEFYNELAALEPDLVCVTAYGKILPKNILDLPRSGCINVHASLLPKLRGAAPINWALIRGCKITGVTTMLMDEGMDTGDMLLTKELPIEDDDTAGTISLKLSKIGGYLLIETIKLLNEGSVKRRIQDHDSATYAPLMKKELGRIDWSQTAKKIRNHIRGVTPWPGAFTTLNGKTLKVFKVSIDEGAGNPGRVMEVDKERLTVAAGFGIVSFEEVQIAGGKRLYISDFLRGRKVEKGDPLGE